MLVLSGDNHCVRHAFDGFLVLRLVGATEALMTLTQDKVPWAVALWVEQHHEEDALQFIVDHRDRQIELGDEAGIAMWEEVGRCLESILQAKARTH